MRFLTKILLAAAFVAAASGTALSGPAIDWDPAYFWEPGATFSSSTPGTELKIVGIISDFDTPFQDLDPSDPSKEYTFYAYGLISNGTTTSGIPAFTFYTTTYSGGTIEIYEDLTPESVFDPNPPNANVPSTYTDGTLILSGSFTSFLTQTNNFTAFQTGNAEGGINWTGGTLIDRTRTGGRPCPGLFTGGLTWRPAVLIPGYLFRHDGKIDLNCPVPVEDETWGRIKSLYR
jgi:hypothetical protein